MTSLKSFFLFCSGAHPTILKRTPVEVNKYVGMGATIFFTGLFAALAAGYASYTVFDTYWISVMMAIFWGLMIFNLDRYIVSTMKKKDTFLANFSMAFPRIILAILIAIVIAKPLELKIFESEIESELVLLQQEKYMMQDALVRDRFMVQIDTLKSEVGVWKNEIKAKEQERDELLALSLAEADGTGGSMQKNLGPIYKTKKAAADKAQADLDQLLASNNNLISAHQERINSHQEKMNAELDNLKRVSLSGFASRLEGLERAATKSEAIRWASLFIMLLFMAIELAPILTKLMMDKSPYDMVLEDHELKYALRNNTQSVAMKASMKSNSEFVHQTQEHKLRAAIKAEKELSGHLLQERIAALKKDSQLTGDFINKRHILDI